MFASSTTYISCKTLCRSTSSNLFAAICLSDSILCLFCFWSWWKSAIYSKGPLAPKTDWEREPQRERLQLESPATSCSDRWLHGLPVQFTLSAVVSCTIQKQHWALLLLWNHYWGPAVSRQHATQAPICVTSPQCVVPCHAHWRWICQSAKTFSSHSKPVICITGAYATCCACSKPLAIA